MKILLWGTYDTGKPRLRILHAGLRAAQIDLREIRVNIWHGVEDKSQVKTLGARFLLLARCLLAYPYLIFRLVCAPRPDLILVGYPGIVDVVVASVIGRLKRVPVAWDVFISVYDTVVEDRQLLKRNGIVASLLYWLERCALRSPELIFMDTRAHARRIELLFRLPPDRCGFVWVGAETEHFEASVRNFRHENIAAMKVLFYGQFIPLHGIPTIVEAARRLLDLPIDWTVIGRGQETSRIRALLEKHPIPSLRWIEWVDYVQLSSYISQSDLCLGIFGESEKAASVIPNKVFQIIAAGKPLITRDSPAIRELLKNAPPCVYLIQPGNASALCEAIREHFASLHQARQTHCHESVAGRIGPDKVGMQFLELIHERLGRK